MELSGLYVREGRAINKAKGALLIAEAIPGMANTQTSPVSLAAFFM